MGIPKPTGGLFFMAFSPHCYPAKRPFSTRQRSQPPYNRSVRPYLSDPVPQAYLMFQLPQRVEQHQNEVESFVKRSTAWVCLQALLKGRVCLTCTLPACSWTRSGGGGSGAVAGWVDKQVLMASLAGVARLGEIAHQLGYLCSCWWPKTWDLAVTTRRGAF